MDDLPEGNDTPILHVDEVKSKAVVKYSTKPATFHTLKSDTDLNLPPSNWLRSAGDSYGLQRVLLNKKGHTSFRMAQMFPDCAGEVDVISDAENIKNLLKIPYDKGHISMIVHRIGNTLLLDKFNIANYVLKRQETDWKWLRDFIYKIINTETYEEEKRIHLNKHRRETLQQKSLVSKFYYYSLVENENENSENANNRSGSLSQLQTPVLPEAVQESADAENFDDGHNRNVVWTFENIEMLIGTDMPIFGGGTHPCISLRLRDMNKPISVLTGIDYWLDNLMSNVPEVAMCYHLDGIVQRYELIKTEDLPRMDNSKFSPTLIRDVAQSILSFLKSNATKAGHTYWLFKGTDEEVVKLYDLTSLCSKDDEDSSQNPFTIPVAMLLYRVARNMKHSMEKPRPSTIRELLANCVKLLPEEKYPEIVTSSHFMLSDLYIPADTNPESPKFDNSGNDTCCYDPNADNDHSECAVLSLDIDNISEPDVNFKPPPPIVGGVDQRCSQAIHHVAMGLSCLKYFKETNTTKINEEEEIPMARPSEPIPMPYEKLSEINTVTSTNASNSASKKANKRRDKRNKKKNNKTDSTSNANKGEQSVDRLTSLLFKNTAEAQPWYGPDLEEISWKEHLKTLLYEKLVLVYAILSESHFIQGHFGSSLRNIGLLARCQNIMNKLQYSSNALRESCLLGRAGDCCIMMVHNWKMSDAYREQLQNHLDEDFKMMQHLGKDEQALNVNIGDSNIKCVFLYDIRTIEQMLLKAVECYEQAMSISENQNITIRLANSLNELGSYYLNHHNKTGKLQDILDACSKCEPYFHKALKLFSNCSDVTNVALVQSNLGHLNRVMAHAMSVPGQITKAEKSYYKKALNRYNKALQVLGERENNPTSWDAVTWEQSTAMLNMANAISELPSSTASEENLKETVEALQKALDHCDMNENHPKYPLYQYRAASLYFSMSAVYMKAVSNPLAGWVNEKNYIHLASINLDRASELYLILGEYHYLACAVRKLCLVERICQTSTSPKTQFENWENGVYICINTRRILKLIIDKKIDIDEQLPTGETIEVRVEPLVKLLLERLQHMLKFLVKISNTSKNPKINSTNELFKRCYKSSLSVVGIDKLSCMELTKKLYFVFEEIFEILYDRTCSV